jgi:hypothetical protein
MSQDIPTIEDWLSLKDWAFTPNVTEGKHGEYFWVRCEGAHFGIALKEILFLPKEFRVLVTYWDSPGGASLAYENEPGWSLIGDYALGPPLKYLPEMHFGAPSSAMLISDGISENEISALLDGFEEFEPYRAETDRFWEIVDRVKPFCYFSDLDEGIYVARGRELYELGFNDAFVAEVAAYFRTRQQSIRQSSWNQLGPECGPEECVEPGCERLRIQLAVRCLLHQLGCGWKDQTL